MNANWTIVAGGLEDRRVIDLLRFHIDTAREVSGIESAHALEPDELAEEGVSFWSAWEGRLLLGIGALKALSREHAEIKSMHVAQTSRGCGVGRAILRHIIAEAQARGHVRLSLETGSMDYFAPARALYQEHGFEICGPFEGYRPDPKSVFMTRRI